MKFETARSLLRVFLAAGVLFGVAGLVCSGTDSERPMVLACAACVALCVFVAVVGLRCPYCNRRIFLNGLRATQCPHCHRKLDSGVKAKKQRKHK